MPTPTTTQEFQVGDHLFCWRSYLGVPFVYQEHGIVVKVQLQLQLQHQTKTIHENDDEGGGDGDGDDDNTSQANNSMIVLNFDAVAELELKADIKTENDGDLLGQVLILPRLLRVLLICLTKAKKER